MWHFKNIPQIVHFYWSGAKLPYLRYFTILSFKKLNPDWKIYLHTEELPWPKNNVHWKGLEQQKVYEGANDYFEQAMDLADEVIFHNFNNTNVRGRHAAVKSDWLRWKLLATEGGLWSDLDIIYNYSIDNLIENKSENADISSIITAAKNPVKDAMLFSIGFLLSSPGDLYYKKISELSNTRHTLGYQNIGSPIANSVYRSFNSTKPLNLNTKCVYTLISNEIEENLTKDPFHINLNIYSWVFNGSGENLLNDKNVIGYHWFGGRPQVKELYEKFENNDLLPESILGYIRNKFEDIGKNESSNNNGYSPRNNKIIPYS